MVGMCILYNQRDTTYTVLSMPNRQKKYTNIKTSKENCIEQTQLSVKIKREEISS